MTRSYIKVDGSVCRRPGRESVCFQEECEECGGRTFGPAVSEEYSPVVFAGGGAVADAYPLVVVESDSALVSGLRPVVSDPALVSVLQLVVSDTARVSVPPVAGCEFPAAL